MKPRTVIILWIIVLLLGVSVFAIKKSAGNDIKNTTNRSAGETFIPDFPVKEIASIHIADAELSVTLQQKDGNWSVVERDGFKANPTEIIGFLRSLIELKVTQGIEAGPSFAPRFGMDEKSSDPAQRGITATFKDASGKSIATISFGKNLDSAASSSPFGGGSVGRFVRNHADESGFYAVSELFPSLSADPKNWLAEEFFKIEKIQSISLSQPGSDKNEWELERDNEEADFKFTSAFPGVKIDPAAVAPLKSLFSYARFDDVVPTAEIEKRANPEKLQTATIKTFEGLTYVLTLQPSKIQGSENYLLNVKVSGELPEKRKPAENEKPEDTAAADKAFEERRKAIVDSIAQTKKLEPLTFEVSKFTVDALLKSRTDLMDKGPGPQTQPGPNPGQGLGPVFSPPVSIPEQ
ncbi:MAG: DUF4340 domain-containing protein [Verrucomicrobiota bacterium]